jgi:tRNA U34 2-thiouridine synthase MnmA/TrmU
VKDQSLVRWAQHDQTLMLAQISRAESDHASLTQHLDEERVRSFGACTGFDIKCAVKRNRIDRVGVHALT